jgi:AAA+ ATPase superfamily predicted ATPase
MAVKNLFVGRSAEIKQLEDYYGVDRNNLIMLYGRSSIGKTKLLLEFTREKSCFYYAAREASEREQLLQMQEEVKDQFHITMEYMDYYHILEAAIAAGRTISTEDGKTIIVMASQSPDARTTNTSANTTPIV